LQIPLRLDHVFVVNSSSGAGARQRPPLVWIGLCLAVAVTVAAGWWLARPRSEAVPSLGAQLGLTSAPSGAVVLVDGKEHGRAPTTVRVPPGRHKVVARHPDALEAQSGVDVPAAGARLRLELWRREPLATRIRPTSPGAAVAGASFLTDGRVALAAQGVPIRRGGALTAEPLLFEALD
jgi:PEGA domain